MQNETVEESFSRTFELEGVFQTVTVEAGIDAVNKNFYRALFQDGRVIYLVLNDATDEWEDREKGATPESIAIGRIICCYDM